MGGRWTRVIFVSNLTFVELWLSWDFDNFHVMSVEKNLVKKVAFINIRSLYICVLSINANCVTTRLLI